MPRGKYIVLFVIYLFEQVEILAAIQLMWTCYRAFSRDVTAAMLVFQNKGMAATMVYQANPLGFELYLYANTVLCFSNPIWLLVT